MDKTFDLSVRLVLQMIQRNLFKQLVLQMIQRNLFYNARVKLVYDFISKAYFT